MVVNQAFVRRYLRDEDPLGREVRYRGTIVGVVGDVRQVGLDRPAEPELFYPAAQNVTMASDIGMSLVVRGSRSLERLVDSIRGAVHGVNPRLAIFNIKSMDQVVVDSLWELNLYRWLIGLFAGLAVLLGAIGLYGVISYNVTSRMREFALRLALGSDPGALARRVLARGAILTGIGIGIGLGAAVALVPMLRIMSAGLQGSPVTYVAVATLLLCITIAACILPALRVASVNPSTALRHD